MASADLAALDRIMMRLGSVGDEQLEGILAKLLVKLLAKLQPGTPLQAKLMEILSHVNRRVKALPRLRLPMADLLQWLHGDGGGAGAPGPMGQNFGMIYVEMGWARMEHSEQRSLIALVMHGLHKRAPRHQQAILGLLVETMAGSKADLPALRDMTAADSKVRCLVAPST
jgi:proteasome component ECM29